MKLFTDSVIALAILLLAGCGEVRDIPRSGDLLFVAIPVEYSLDSTDITSGITQATGRGELNYIHVAILEVEPDTTWIIDATIKHGVDRHPLETFLSDFTLKDGSLPHFEVMRIKGGPRDMVANAKKYLGEPYDVWFAADNGAHYCTELVRDSYLDADGNPVFEEAPMNFKNSEGEIPVYWKQLFGLLGTEVPQGEPGTNPQDMRQSKLLEFVTENLR